VESPKQADRDLQADDLPRTTNNKPPSDDRRLVTTSGEKIELAIPRQTLGSLPETERRTPQRTKTEPSYQLNMQKTPSASDTPEIWRKGDSLRLLDNHEIKVHAGEPKPNSADAANSKGVERRDTSVSLVAAMRNRYSYAVSLFRSQHQR
jgi:hypothetical protein